MIRSSSSERTFLSLHQDLAAADRRIDDCIHQPEDQVSKEVLRRERCGRLIVQDCQVGRPTLSQFTQR